MHVIGRSFHIFVSEVVPMSGPLRISGEELVYLASTLAIAISKELNADTVNILSNFFNAVGDSLGIIAAQRAACSSSKNQSGAL